MLQVVTTTIKFFLEFCRISVELELWFYWNCSPWIVIEALLMPRIISKVYFSEVAEARAEGFVFTLDDKREKKDVSVCSKVGHPATRSCPEATLQRKCLKFTFSCDQVWRQPVLLASPLSGRGLEAVTHKTKFWSRLKEMLWHEGEWGRTCSSPGERPRCSAVILSSFGWWFSHLRSLHPAEVPCNRDVNNSAPPLRHLLWPKGLSRSSLSHSLMYGGGVDQEL